MKRLSLLFCLALGLSACGFHLRGTESTLARTKVRIVGLTSQEAPVAGASAESEIGASYSPDTPVPTSLGTLLAAALERHGATVVDKPDDQAYVLQISTEQSTRNLSLNRTGLAVEQDLGYKVSYEIKTAKGEIIEPLKKVKFNREQYNDQFLILGRTQETNIMRQEMREEAAETLARRVVYVLKDRAVGTELEQPAAPAAAGEGGPKPAEPPQPAPANAAPQGADGSKTGE